MRKYRVKQIGNKYYPQYKFLFLWYHIADYGNDIECSSLLEAKNEIKQFDKFQKESRTVVKKVHKVDV